MSHRRPLIAMVGTGLTPYRVHFLRRLDRELPEAEFVTLNTMHPSIEPWRLQPPTGIRFEQVDTRPRLRGGLVEQWAQWRIGGKVISRLRALRPDAVIVNGYHRVGHLRVMDWCISESIPTLFASDSNVHADLASGITRALKTRVVKWVVRRCDPILVCGSLGRQYFEKYGARPDQCVYVPYEPDYDQLAIVSDEVVRRVKERYGLNPARKRLVFCARMAEQKRPDIALDAFISIADEHPDWDLVMVGDGPQREWLQFRVPSDLVTRVRFTGFIKDTAEVSALYRQCHAMVLTSDWEPWGVVVNEAVAAGLAVISTNVVGASAELVRDGVNGRLVPPGNFRLMAQAYRDVMSPGRVEAMRAKSPEVLADWRRRGDPIAGMRDALGRVGLLGSAPRTTRRPLKRTTRDHPKVIFVGGGLTPYRVHLLNRLAAECPQVERFTITTRHPFFEPWKTVAVPGQRVTHLDPHPPPLPDLMTQAGRQWSIGSTLIDTLAREEPDAVVFHSYDHLAHLRGMDWCRRRRIPAFLYADSNLHGDRPAFFQRIAKRRIIPWVARRVRNIFVFGSLGRRYYERYGVPGDQCVFCPMEPDYAQIERVTQADIRGATDRFGLDPARKRFVFVGRVTPVKGPDVLLKAFTQIAAQAPDWDLLMVGDGPMRAECEALVPADLKHRVKWAGFVADQRVVSALYRASHVFVLPSTYEPWALVVNEAAAAGLPLITTDVVGASAELVRDGENGRRVPPGQVQPLADALLEAAAPGAAERMGEASLRVLAHWREVADPVRNMMAALARAGVRRLE
jgi:glycosyltransferase involved in cell wall biosynthesis